jgi:hypothetical protein
LLNSPKIDYKNPNLANKPNFAFTHKNKKFFHFKPIHNFFAKNAPELALKLVQVLILCLVSVERFLPPSPCVMSKHICLKKINIIQNTDSLLYRVLTKRKVPIRSGLLDHRGPWAIDIEYFGYRELEESGLAHVQTPNMRSHDLITVVDQRERVDR